MNEQIFLHVCSYPGMIQKISIDCEKIAQIYLPYLPHFASLDGRGAEAPLFDVRECEK